MSPSFSMQEIIEPKHTHWQVDPTSSCPKNTNASGQADSPDIEAVSYYSDGKILNATMMLHGTLKKVSSHHLFYDMIIIPYSLYETSNNLREIYDGKIYSEEPGKWFKWVYERFSDSLIHTIHNTTVNYTDFFHKDDNSTSLSLDLTTIGSPNQYLLAFQATDNSKIKGEWCRVIDITPWFPIPQPKFSISAIPSSIVLRPGEKKYVDLEVVFPVFEMRSNFNSKVILSPQPITGYYGVSPKNSTIYIPSHGLNTTSIIVTAPENPRPNETLPVTHPIAIKAVFTIINYGIFGPNIQRDRIYSPSSTNNITTTFSNLTVTLLPPLTFSEKFGVFWSTYGQVISLVGGGFAAGAAALFFNRLFKTESGTT
jgi:hypothetical protein